MQITVYFNTANETDPSLLLIASPAGNPKLRNGLLVEKLTLVLAALAGMVCVPVGLA
jgi:hypothetical protein